MPFTLGPTSFGLEALRIEGSGGCHTGRLEQPGGLSGGDRFYRAGAVVVLVATVLDFLIDPSWLIGGVLTAYGLFFGWALRERRRRG